MPFGQTGLLQLDVHAMLDAAAEFKVFLGLVDDNLSLWETAFIIATSRNKCQDLLATDVRAGIVQFLCS